MNEYKCKECQTTWQLEGHKPDGKPVDYMDEVSWCPVCEGELEIVNVEPQPPAAA